MNLFRYLMPLASAMIIAASTTLSADSATAEHSRESFHRETRQRDFDAVQRFVNAKRTIPLEEKESNLTIAGDVRFAWANVSEKVAGDKLRGQKPNDFRALQDESNGNVFVSNNPDLGVPFSNNVFDVEFNLYVDYACDRTWAVAWLEYANSAGIEHNWKTNTQDPNGLFGSGSGDGICLKKAYIGYNILADGCNRLDVELGRRPLYTVFDSRVQFNNRFDGLLFKYARGFDCWGKFYWNLGGFVVDERADDYAYVTEMGLLDIANYGFDVKYSFIDWVSLASHHNNRARKTIGNVRYPAGLDFRVSQITAAYNMEPEYLCKPVKLYGAYLHNHSAKHGVLVNQHGKENNAWYAGVLVGQVCRENDWSIEVNYQYVEAFAIPDSDASGVGSARNVLRDTITANGRGYTNYKGWFAEAVYALTDNLSLDARFEQSKQIDQDLTTLAQQGSTPVRAHNSKHHYTMFRLEAIYAF